MRVEDGTKCRKDSARAESLLPLPTTPQSLINFVGEPAEPGGLGYTSGECVRVVSRALYGCSGDAGAQSLVVAAAATIASAAAAPGALSTVRGAPEGRRRCGYAGGGLR